MNPVFAQCLEKTVCHDQLQGNLKKIGAEFRFRRSVIKEKEKQQRRDGGGIFVPEHPGEFVNKPRAGHKRKLGGEIETPVGMP